MPTYSPTEGVSYPLPTPIRYCRRCVMPNTRPGLEIGEDGVCDACKRYEARQSIDWAERWLEFSRIVQRYHRRAAGYDCIVTVSSGKDSWHQVKTMLGLGLTPLLLSVDNLSWTDVGRRNAERMSDRFNCDLLRLELPRGVARTLLRKAFHRLLAPCWYWDRAVYSWPLQMSAKLKIPLVIYGENIGWEYGGVGAQDTLSAETQAGNGVVLPVPVEEWIGDGVEPRHFIAHQSPASLRMAGVRPIYLSWAAPWDGYDHYQAALADGWQDLRSEGEEGWERQGLAEQYDQIDTVGYGVHPWLKFVKFGHQHQSDILSQYVRSGRMKRSEAVKRVLATEHILDGRMLADFLAFTGITPSEFWSTIDLWANRRMLRQVEGRWRLTPESMDALKEGGVVG